MTRGQLESFLDLNFDKWKATETFSYGFVEIKVKGPISVNTIARLNNMLDVRLDVYFYTMGFFESLFASRRCWKVEL